MKPIYLQLYSVREACEKDLEGTLKLVKEMGYEGVEAAGFHGRSAKEFKELLKRVGLKCASAHLGLGDIAKSIEDAKALGIKYFIVGFGPSAFTSRQLVDDSIAKFKAAAKQINAAGFKTLMHNHWWEFQEVDNRVIFDIIKDEVPEMDFELDCYWCCNFGKFNPAEVLTKNADRVKIVHFKDGAFERNKPFCALGEGLAKLDDLVKASDYKGMEFMTVEIDNCEGDMLETIRRSFKHLDGLRKKNA